MPYVYTTRIRVGDVSDSHSLARPTAECANGGETVISPCLLRQQQLRRHNIDSSGGRGVSSNAPLPAKVL